MSSMSIPADTEHEIRTSVRDALRRAADLDARSIEIESTNDGVWLRGRVHSVSARQIAEDAVWSSPGVQQVFNELVIR